MAQSVFVDREIVGLGLLRGDRFRGRLLIPDPPQKALAGGSIGGSFGEDL
jgi:hypothetical protein